MSELSIKVSIANRTYPLKITVEEEELIRRAAKLINDRIRDYEDNFAVKDKQDVLSMCSLQLATELMKLQLNSVSGFDELEKEIDSLNTILTQTLG